MLKFQELLNFTIIKQYINLQINIILNAKLIRIQKSSLPIYFTLTYVLEDFYIYYISMVEVICNGELMCICLVLTL